MTEVSWADRPEQIVMSQSQYSLRCPDCGSREVAVSTWKRLVECPDIVWEHYDWPLPLQAHNCLKPKDTNGRRRPVWEAYSR